MDGLSLEQTGVLALFEVCANGTAGAQRPRVCYEAHEFEWRLRRDNSFLEND